MRSRRNSIIRHNILSLRILISRMLNPIPRTLILIIIPRMLTPRILILRIVILQNSILRILTLRMCTLHLPLLIIALPVIYTPRFHQDLQIVRGWTEWHQTRRGRTPLRTMAQHKPEHCLPRTPFLGVPYKIQWRYSLARRRKRK
jgi:hypothetical protein